MACNSSLVVSRYLMVVCNQLQSPDRREYAAFLNVRISEGLP
jgi:hypothetical protein